MSAPLSIGSARLRRYSLPLAVVTAAAVVAAGALGACAFGDDELADLANNGVPETPSYDEAVHPIMVEHCTSCHSEDAQEIAQVVPSLDNEGDVLDSICRVNVRAVEERSMPPGAMQRLDAYERLVLERWMLVAYRGARPSCPEVIEQDDDDSGHGGGGDDDDD